MIVSHEVSLDFDSVVMSRLLIIKLSFCVGFSQHYPLVVVSPEISRRGLKTYMHPDTSLDACDVLLIILLFYQNLF